MNKVYRNALTQFNNMRWVMFGAGYLERKFADPYYNELEEAHKEYFPRRKKIVLENLPEEISQPILEKWQRRALAYYNAKKRQHLLLFNWLESNAFNVELVKDEIQVVTSVGASKYRSQSNTYGYTRKEAEQHADLLRKYGFVAEVKDVRFCDVLDSDTKSLYMCEVWANCEPYIFDVLQRIGRMSEEEWAHDCWGRGMNPKVLNPFMDDKVYKESLGG